MSWIQTYSGQKFYPCNPDPEAVRIVDIAHALSMICRFAGNVKTFYSVGQHCVYTADWLLCHFESKKGHGLSKNQIRQIALLGLLHDAAEAYMGDIPRPVKAQFREAKAIEDRLLRVILSVVAPSVSPEFTDRVWSYVTAADNTMLGAEARDLFNGGCVEDWNLCIGILPADTVVVPCGHDRAEAMFLEMYYRLGGGE
jgi:hypothetical protein